MPIPSSTSAEIHDRSIKVYNDLFYYSGGSLFWKNNMGSNKVKDKKAGFITSSGYFTVCVLGGSKKVHRIIWEMHKGTIPTGFFIDHIDRNKTNNNIQNLRLTNFSLNAANSKKRDNCRSKYKGVAFAYGSTFVAKAGAGKRKTKYLGTFRTEKEAAIAYDSYVINFFGQHALTNKMLYPEDFI